MKKILAKREMMEISENVLVPYREMLEENPRTARAFLEMGCNLYGIEKVMFVASFFGVNDLPIKNGRVVRV